MEGQADGVNSQFLTDSILKILTIQGRVEEKLDLILARPNTHANQVSIPTASDDDAFREFSVDEMAQRILSSAPITFTGEGSKGRASTREEHRSFTNCPSEGDTRSRTRGGHGAVVQMRSHFQLLIDDLAGEEIKQFSGSSSLLLCDIPLRDDVSGKNVLSHYIPVSPDSPFLLAWSVSTILVLLTELTYVPFMLAWGSELTATSVGTLIFWFVDIAVSFISGTYSTDGELNPLRISARAYALRWFPLDMLIVLLDAISFFQWDNGGEVKLLRFSKLARVLRILAILRVSRLYRSYSMMMDTAPFSRLLQMTFRVAYFCVVILWTLHLVACCWFLIGNLGPTDTGKRWVDLDIHMTDGTTIDLASQTKIFQYMICFHWSVATFTLGSMEVGYASSFERVFYVVFTISSFLFGSVLVSLLSTVFVDHHTQSLEAKVKLRTLNRFLVENHVSNNVVLRIKVCLERERTKEKLALRDTIALKSLPTSLYRELCYEVTGCFLQQHDLFNSFSTFDVRITKNYSADGVEMTFLHSGDELFKAHDDSEDAYFFSSGELMYSKSEHSRGTNMALVPAGTWLSEASLWSHWRHVGSCEAKSECKFAVANYQKLAECIKGHCHIRDTTRSYCELFCNSLALARPPISEFADDLSVPFTKFAGMLIHFPNHLRRIIGTKAIEQSRLRGKRATGLMAEIDAGTCDAYINTQGELERIVLVTVLKLQNDQKAVLYKIGEFVSSTIEKAFGEKERQLKAVPRFQLPGLRQDPGESIKDTLMRLVERKLSILKDKFEHIGTTLEDVVGVSEKARVKTRYLRTKVVGLILGAFPATPVVLGNLADADQPVVKRTPRSKSVDPISMAALEGPLYLIFDGKKACIYAWLAEDVVESLQQNAFGRRDEYLSHMLGRVNLDFVEQAFDIESESECTAV